MNKTVAMTGGLLVATVLGGAATRGADQAAPSLALASKGGPEAAAVCLFASIQDPAAERAIGMWKRFFEERGCPVRVVLPAAAPQFPGKGAIMAFETEDNCPVAKAANVDISGLNDSRPESHLLVSKVWSGRPLVLVVGKAAIGADCGSARLLSKVVCWDGTMSMPVGEEFNRPFFNGREMMICPSAKWPTSIKGGYNFMVWPKERLGEYPGFLRACGFNSVQLVDIWGYWLNRGLSHKTTKPKFRLLAETARKEGMSVSQFVWGAGSPEVFAKAYADVVDHLVTHWADPGPGGYAMPQERTAALLEAYRKINPKVRATVSAWYNKKFWDGDPTAKTLLDETFAAREVGIALHRWWDDETNHGDGRNPERAELVLKSGRRLGVWGWYLCDYEVADGDHLRNRVLDAYFSSLPEEASTKVDWLSLEKNTHGSPSRICQFVAGQKMWNPKRPLREIMMDYCRSMYGPVHAATMCDAFECAEATGPQFTPFRGAAVKKFAHLRDSFPGVWKDADYAARMDRVLADLENVNFPEDWKPNLPDIGSIAGDVTALRERLTAARERFKKTLGK